MMDIHALSGAYAVDALDDIERAQFERHLSECDACRDEVDSLREAGALLAESAPLTPPGSLRDRVLADIATVRPLPPLVTHSGAAAADRDREVPTRPTGRRWFPALVAAAAVAGVIGVGTTVVQPWKDEPGTSQSPDVTLSAAERIRAAEDHQAWTHTFDDGGRATLLRSEELNEAVIVTRGLKPAPDGKVYQAWLQQDGDMVSAGLMPEGPDTVLPLEGQPAEASGFGITVEPAGGSPEPTGDPIAFIAFQA